jgi:NB-ARC domain
MLNADYCIELICRSVIFKPILPPPPRLMVGRDTEQSQVVGMLLNHTKVCVAILGAGGMGRTTLALSILHDLQVIDKYQQWYFVSCEAVSSVSVLLGEIANALDIPLSQCDEHLFSLLCTTKPSYALTTLRLCGRMKLFKQRQKNFCLISVAFLSCL